MYKVVSRVVDGKTTIGYGLISEDSKRLILDKEKVLMMARDGLIVNAGYNKNTHKLYGIGVDLRELVTTEININSNHELCKRYIEKLGRNNPFKFEFMGKDKILLTDVLDKNNNGKIVIPSFVTYVKKYDGYTGLQGCKFSEVYIDNKEGEKFDATYLCGGMLSNKLKVVFRNPKCVVGMFGMFERCSELVELDVSNLDTSNTTNMGCMFQDCSNLRTLDLRNFDTRRVTDMDQMFYNCEKLEYVDLSSFDIKNVKSMRSMFKKCKNVTLVGGNFKLNNSMELIRI